jgi:L-gulonolactone oxidase
MMPTPAAAELSGEPTVLANFGGNEVWRSTRHVPGSDDEVLAILARHRAERVRAVGSLHSWSDAVVAPGVTLDLRRLCRVSYDQDDGTGRVRVEAGCTLQALLDYLDATAGRTLPTMGVIKRQTVAGLISTGTHGSGHPSVGHFVTAVRAAAFDAEGVPTIYEDRDGKALRASRCGLGTMGIVLSVELRTVPRFRVRETVLRVDAVGDALRLFADHPLTQFALVPHTRKILVWQRETVGGYPGWNGPRTWFFRAFNVLGVDVGFHLLLKTCLWLGQRAVRALMKLLPYMLLTGVSRVDDEARVLTQLHHLFRHEEMELFVPESAVADAAELLRHIIAVHAGDEVALAPDAERRLRDAGLYEELVGQRGTYLHHYPMLFRRVLPDDALVSMASGQAGPWFSFSLFSYDPPGKRDAYYRLCSLTARAMHALFGARLHWGKHYPLGSAETAAMYPDLPAFRRICVARDPGGVFRNAFTSRVLDLP